MIQANIHELKAKLSDYLAAALRGERVVIARRNVPVAQIDAGNHLLLVGGAVPGARNGFVLVRIPKKK